MSAAQCKIAAKTATRAMNKAAGEIWLAACRARVRAGDEQPVAIGHAYRIELLYRTLVVVMGRRAAP